MQPWVAPDARPQEVVSAAVERPDGDQPSPGETPVPVAMRPMTVADILDGAVAVIKAAPRTILTIAATILVPLELVSAWVQRDSLADRGLAGAISAATSSSNSSNTGFDLSVIVLIVASGLALSLVTGAVAALLRGWYAETSLSASEALRLAMRRAPALIAAWFLVHLIEVAAAVLLIIPALFVVPLLMTTAPIIVFEDRGPVAAIRRSWRLGQSRFGAALGAAVLIGIVSSLLTLALSGVGLAFEFLSFGWIIDAVARGASGLVTEPFVAAATTLVYLDIRVRTEGLDLEFDIAERFTHAAR